MKAFKRLAVFVVALLMAFMSVMLVACDGAGGGNGAGGDGDNTGGDKTSAEVVATAIDNLTKQKLSSVTGTVAVTPSKYVSKELREGGYNYNFVFDGQNFFDATVAGNYSSGQVDLFNKVYYGKEEGEEGGLRPYYTYMFLRDWNMYSDFTREETAIADLDLYNDGNLADNMGLKPDYIEKMARFNHLFVYLSNATDAITVSGNTMTADLNKMLYGLVGSLKETINLLTPTMTVGELLRDNTVKNLLSAAVNMITPEDAVKIALENLADNPDIQDIAEIVVKVLDKVEVDEGSTTYDYLLKLISSDEMYEAVSDIVKEEMDITLPAKLDSITLNFLVDTFNLYESIDYFVKEFDETKSVTDFASMKEGLSFVVDETLGNTTQDAFVLDLNFGEDKLHIEVSKAKIVYQLADGKIASMHAEGEYKHLLTDKRYDYDYDIEDYVSYITEETFECTASADIDFAAQKQTVAQIVLPQNED